MDNVLFTPLKLKNISLPNRFIRSATYEGRGDDNGIPSDSLTEMYLELCRGGIGTIVTGFVFISQQGRAMQPRQCGISDDSFIEPWKNVISPVLELFPQTKLFMQIAHTGRQTLQSCTGMNVVGASSKKCSYFRQPVTALDGESIQTIISDFVEAAGRAKKAGFHGVQIHAAHGYLIHQFLSSWTNNRKDKWGDRGLFLSEIISAIKKKCGMDFPILIKLSHADDRGLSIDNTLQTIKRLEDHCIDGVELSYGTMEYAMNIFRGNCPVDVVLEVNPLFNTVPKLLRSLWKVFFKKSYLKKFAPFQENYNLKAAEYIKQNTNIPIISVGGLRTERSMVECITHSGLDAVAMCRPLLREPDLPQRIRNGQFNQSKCCNCNLCAIHCDSVKETECHIRMKRKSNNERIKNL